MTVFWIVVQEFETDPGIPFVPLQQGKAFPDLSSSLKHFSRTSDQTLPKTRLLRLQSINNPKCQVRTFGYSEQQARDLFPKRNFKDCGSPGNHSAPLFVCSSSNSFTLTCSGQVSVGLPATEEEFGNVDFPGDFESVASTFSLNTSEYFFVRCQNRVSAHYELQEREEVVSRVQKKQEKILKKTKKGFKPLSVHVLTFDSLSRQSFYRNFPKTVDFLNSSESDWLVFDQHLSVVHGPDTQANLIPMFYGHSSGEHWDELRGLSIFKESDRSRYLQVQEKAIWNHFSRLGFVTMFSYDTVWDFFSYTIGRKITTDHVGSRFFHAAKKFSGYQDFSKDKQCIGNESSDFYSLKYLQDFAFKYQGMNKFSYSHLSQGHEHSGQVIQTVDQNLEKVMKAVLMNYLKHQQDFVIFLMADHGKHSNEWDLNYEGILENRLPLWITLTNKEFFLRTGSKIQKNQEKLVSRLDFFLTLKHLATCPYGRLEDQSSVYKTWQKEIRLDARSVFLEDLPFRTCEEVGILEEFCPCEGLKELKFNGEKYLEQIFELAIEENRKKQAMIRVECQELHPGKILKVSAKKIKEERFLTRFIQIAGSIEGISESYVEVLAYLTTEQEMQRLSKRSLKVDFLGSPAAVSILSFSKNDSLKTCSTEVICYCNQ